MNDETSGAAAGSPYPSATTRVLSPAARRALAEAEARRATAATAEAASPPPEIDGRTGPEPTRFGDWERNGIACDF